MPTTQTPRGIRNHNPGNIRWGDEWKGLLAPEARTDKDFCQFQTPEYGIRAIVVIMRKYSTKPGIPGVGRDRIDTVREVISRWAPPSENDTESYCQHVAAACDTTPDSHIDLFDNETISNLVKSIIRHENGMQPYTDQQINYAIGLAS